MLSEMPRRSKINSGRLAVIPARGGSKRIPRKNIKPFYGKPIILRVLDEISSSGLFDEIHVSTEDDEIRDIVSEAGFSPKFLRAPSLSGDYVPLADVLASVIHEYGALGESFNTIAMIFATAVLLDRDTLVKAVSEFERGDRMIQMISVAKYPVPIEWAMRMGEGGLLDPVDAVKLSMRSQDLADAWFETADFVLYSEQSILSHNVNSRRRGFRVPHIPVDIDTEADWQTAEMVYRLKKF